MDTIRRHVDTGVCSFCRERLMAQVVYKIVIDAENYPVAEGEHEVQAILTPVRVELRHECRPTQPRSREGSIEGEKS